MFEESPVKLGDPAQDYYLFLSMFNVADNIWIGYVKDSGRHPQNFRSAWDLKKLDEPIGQFTTGANYKLDTVSRSNDTVEHRVFLVVESDVLTKPEMGAVFQLMRDLFSMKLHAVVDTG